ncbi:probable apyrase 6 [Typha angustifolia]|uniref:probable apyrase 6 n=1 Tax=Typha angustifolia TaxID=59011 RepID=UPI003C2E5499
MITFPNSPFRPVPPRFSLLSRISSSTPRNSRRSLMISLTSASVAVVFIVYLIVSTKTSHSTRFGIVIDAGSSGTRIHVFGYNNERGDFPLLDLDRTAVMRVSPGLSSYVEEPERAGDSLVELLEFAKGKVEKDLRRETEVRLMGTAGLRMVDGGVREKILESCRRVLRESGFRFRDDWATVIPGSDEGIYAWVAANYALGSLGGDPQKTTGVIELGGASAQITFVSDEPLPPESSHELKFQETTYKLYSNSFLHFGQNTAYKSLHEMLTSEESAKERKFIDPCAPKKNSEIVEPLRPATGAFRSKLEYQPVIHAGNFSDCRSAILMLLQKGKENCLYQQCNLGLAFVPELHGSFLATENFFFTSKFFGLGATSTLSDLALAGKQFCEGDLLKLKEKYNNLDEEDLSRYCFSSAYIVALLHDSLGISLGERRIEFANQVGDTQIEWALGAFLMQRVATDLHHANWITSVVRNDFVLLLLVVSTLLVFSTWLVSKWRRPELKTIYDLEKGRYIITRVS